MAVMGLMVHTQNIYLKIQNLLLVGLANIAEMPTSLIPFSWVTDNALVVTPLKKVFLMNYGNII
jgi:hypothetical protein